MFTDTLLDLSALAIAVIIAPALIRAACNWMGV